MSKEIITDSATALAVASEASAQLPPKGKNGNGGKEGKPPRKSPPAKPSTIPANRGLKKGQTKDTGRRSGAETKDNKIDRKPVLLAVAKGLLEVERLLLGLEKEIAPSWASGGRKVMRLAGRTGKLAVKMEKMATKWL